MNEGHAVRTCTCHPRALAAHHIKWIEDKRGLPAGWYIHIGRGIFGEWVAMTGLCLMCRGRLWERPRPTEWLESGEYLASMTAHELQMAGRQGKS